jgi:peptidoglycan-associated lipoprotein
VHRPRQNDHHHFLENVMIRTSRLALVVLVASAALGACRKKPEVAPAPTPPPINQDSIDAANRARDAAAAAARARQDSINAANARAAEEERLRREREAAARAEAVRAITAPIYFDYDQAEITADSRAILDAKLPLLTANTGLRIRIGGHTDSRGSDEYNMALGQRRAAAAKRYLTGRGIADNRIDIVSFGEERPVAMGSDEGSYSQNRRDEFEITAGGDNIMPPR